MKIKIPRISIDTIIVFLVVLFNNETLANNYCQFMDQPVRIVTVLVVIFGIFCYTKGRHRSHLNQNAFIVSLLLSVLVLVGMANDGTYTNGYLLTWMSIISGTVLAIFIDYDDFSERFVSVMSLLSVISLLCTYVIQFVFSPLLSVFPVITNSANVSFYNMGLCYIVRSSSFYRNFGIFREPGVYAIFLCLALMMMLVKYNHIDASNEKKKITKRIALFSVTLFTTFSTTGYLSYILIIVFYFMLGKAKTSNTKRNLGGLLVFILAVASSLFLAPESDMIVNPFSKLTVGSSGYSSFIYRMETITNGISLIIKNPIGLGLIRGNNALRQASTTLRFHNTNTLISFGLYFGLPFLIISIIGLFRNFKTHFENAWFILPFLLLLSGEVLIYNAIIYAIILGGSVINIKESPTGIRVEEERLL